VRGPINEFDFMALCDLLQFCDSLAIDLRFSKVENKSIPDNVFYQAEEPDKIVSIILPDDIHTIGQLAFSNLSKLRKINIPTGLKKIGFAAFQGCGHLAIDTLQIPESVDTIPAACFNSCLLIKHISLPKTLRHVGNTAFNQNISLQSISLQEGIESIGTLAFAGMGTIDTIRLPESIKKIRENAFAYNNSLKYLNIPSGIRTIPMEFVVNGNLDNIYIPDNVITIEEGAFSGNRCTRLRLSESLTTIEREAFRGNALTDILLPASLRFIGSQAFASETVQKVYCPANIPPALESTDKGEWAFAGCNDNTTLFVPVGCGDTYRNTPGWNNFSRIEEIEQFPSSIEQVNDATTWTATGGKGMIHLQNNSATSVRLNVYTLGGELNKSIELQSRTSIEVAPGSYLISDGQHAKTVIVK